VRPLSVLFIVLVLVVVVVTEKRRVEMRLGLATWRRLG
jgi:hypothetical protein